MLVSGVYDEHLAGLRAEHALRQQAMLHAIAREIPDGAILTRRVDGGLFLWCRLGPGLSGRSLLREAAAAGVTFAAGEHFYADDAGGDEIRLCFSSVSPIRIGEGMRRLGAIIRRESTGSPLRTELEPVPLP
jgi:2-aminoadipate transaminase